MSNLLLAPRYAAPTADPHPYDVVVMGYGLMTGDPEKGPRHKPLTSSKPDDFAGAAPPVFAYSSMNPKMGAVTPYGSMPLGFGQREQSEDPQQPQDPRYRYTLNANLAFGVWQKGPDVTTISPAGKADAPVRNPFEIPGTAGFFWTNGQYLYKMDAAGTVSQVHDFGAGKSVTDVAVFWSNGLAKAWAYFAMGDGTKIWRFDGTAAPDQHADLEAISFLVLGKNLWRGHDRNKVSLVTTDADPWVTANWAAPNSYYVGDRAFTITKLSQIGGVMLVMKEDGPYTFDLENPDPDEPLYPDLRLTPDSESGVAQAHYVNDLYFTHQKGTYKIDRDLVIDQVGPEEMVDNDTPVKGKLTAYIGHEKFYLFAGMWNEDTSTSYLMQFGGWIEGPLGKPERIDVWHGSITDGYASKMTTMATTTVAAPEDHRLMVIGFADGTLKTFVLPCVPNPLGCEHYRWSTTDGSVFLPTWHAKFKSNIKALRAITVSALNFSTSTYVEVDYKTDLTSATWVEMPFPYDGGQRETHDFPSGLAAVLVDLRVRLVSSVNTETPQVQGLGFHHQLHTELRQIKVFDVLCANGLADRMGKALRYGAHRIKQILKQAHDSPSGVTMLFPDEEEKVMKIIGWDEVQAWDRRDEVWRSAVRITASEVTQETDDGTYGRIEGLTYAQAESMTYGGLEVY